MGQNSMIAPVNWSGEDLVHLAAKNPDSGLIDDMSTQTHSLYQNLLFKLTMYGSVS